MQHSNTPEGIWEVFLYSTWQFINLALTLINLALTLINLALTLIFPLQPEKYLPTPARVSKALITGLLRDHGGELSFLLRPYFLGCLAFSLFFFASIVPLPIGSMYGIFA